MVLTERQKDILSKEGLPTNYDELSLSQKSAIVAIEDMFNYVENKYNEQFKYLGYVAASSLEKEHLNVYPTDKSSQDIVTVYRDYVDGKYVYSDNYSLLEANTLYQKAINDFFGDFTDVNCKAFSNVTNSNEAASLENIVSNSSASTYVFIDYKTCDENAFLNIVNKFSAWIENESNGQSSSSTTFLLVDSDQFSEISKYNYSNKVYEIAEISKKVVIVSLEGNVTIR